MSAEPQEMIVRRFARARQNQRSASKDSAKENLQAAIPADVIEGSPDHVRFLTLSVLERRGQAREIMSDHFGGARRRAGREEYPFCGAEGKIGLISSHFYRTDMNLQR